VAANPHASSSADRAEVSDALPDEVQLVVTALAVVKKRIAGLPKEDQDTLYALFREMANASGADERATARRAIREVLDQAPVRAIPLPEPGEAPGLAKWSRYVGGRIKVLREKAGLSQSELAKRAGIPQPHLSRLENAEHSPTHKTLSRIAKALGIPVGDLDPSHE
jgi:DNA-binding XRE family transcriptional regulator